MRQTRDAYREPVSLLEVEPIDNCVLRFTIRALFTHNTSTFHLDYAAAN